MIIKTLSSCSMTVREVAPFSMIQVHISFYLYVQFFLTVVDERVASGFPAVIRIFDIIHERLIHVEYKN